MSASSLHIFSPGRPDPVYQVWPLRDTLPEGFVREGGTYTFELRGTADQYGAELYLDGAPLEGLAARAPGTARWGWSPGFHAGEVELSLWEGNRQSMMVDLTTDTDTRKLNRSSFDQMVRDILQDSLHLFTETPFRIGVERGTGDEDTPELARLEFLRSRLEAVESVVREIAAQPVRVLHSQSRGVPIERARRLTGPELARSLRGRPLVEVPRLKASLPQALGGHLPPVVRQQVRRDGTDIAEHQWIKAALESWRDWLSAASGRMQARADGLGAASGRNEKRDLLTRWAQRTTGLSRRLGRLLQLDLFQNVSAPAGPLTVTSVSRRIPAYRRFLSLFRDLQLGIARTTGDFLQVPIARTWELYELWCFLRVTRALGSRVVHQEEREDDGDEFLPPAHSIEIRLQSGQVLTFQKTYREYWLAADGTGSFSRRMRPDLAVSIPDDDDIEGVVVLDAKYVLSKNLGGALSSIHTYRDAIVADEDDGLRRVVRGAYLLTPHVPGASGSDWKDAAMPDRLFFPSYRGSFRFGALTLKPGMDLADLQSALDAVLADATQA